MSLGTDGSLESIDSAIQTASKTALRQEVIALRAENQWLRQQLAEQQEQIEEHRAELKRYKNAHTPSSEQGGAGGGSGNNGSDDTDTDDNGEAVEKQVRSVFSGTRFVLTNGITEVEDAKQMAQFFRGVDDWPLSNEDAVTLGVDTDRAELADGWCQEFLDEYENTQSVRAEDLLSQTVQRGGTYRGTPQESISALLITLATANKIALRRDDEYITEPDEIGRAVRNKTNLTDVQIRFESIGDTDRRGTGGDRP